MRSISLVVFLLALAACSTNSADSADASAEDGSDLDSGFARADSAILGFDDVSAPDVLLGADKSCAPACPAGDFCFAIVYSGGGKYPLSGGDAGPPDDAGSDGALPLGCYPVPAACDPSPTCACVLANMGDPGGRCTRNVTCTEDAGAVTALCSVVNP